jgi:hypothetical protein
LIPFYTLGSDLRSIRFIYTSLLERIIALEVPVAQTLCCGNEIEMH